VGYQCLKQDYCFDCCANVGAVYGVEFHRLPTNKGPNQGIKKAQPFDTWRNAKDIKSK
jgi:hypothetical protein